MRSPTRWIVVALAFLAAGAFAISVTAGQWWSIADATVGPFGTRSCMRGFECHSRGLAWTTGSAGWERAAVATGAAGLIATLVLLVVAGAAAAGRRPRMAAMSTIAAMLAAAVAGYVFVTGLPTFAETTIDRGLVLFVVGLVFGLAAAVVVLRARKLAG